jgi:hypothetical protein
MPGERRRQFSLVALAPGNLVAGLGIFLPTGMLAELALGLGGTPGPRAPGVGLAARPFAGFALPVQ